MPIEPMGPVVVGVDGSPVSLAAVDLAAEEATGRVVPLIVVHAHDERMAERPAPDKVARLLEVAVSRAYADHPSMSVSAELLIGEPAGVLIERSREASLLVVGHRRFGPYEPSAGSVAQQLARRAEVPIMVRRPLDTTAPTRVEPWPVVVCVAGRPGDDEVVEFAFGEAALRGAPLWAVHIWPGSAAETAGPHSFAQAQTDADRVLVDALATWSEKYPDVPVHRVVRHGLDVPVALTAASRSAQLIVVGTSRRRGEIRTHPWVVEALVHRAGCSVVVVPAQ